jgi:pantoate--beta-alanine ligase
VREPDGLAMSSRNALLSHEERSRALALPAALRAASELAGKGERSARVLLDAARTAMLRFEVEPEYLALVDPETLESCDTLAGESLLAVAARIGQVRLIDNAVLQPAGASSRQPLPRKAIA